MAFQPPTIHRAVPQSAALNIQTTSQIQVKPVEESQEWILFTPQQAQSSTHATSQTVGLSQASELDSIPSGLRSGRLESSVLDDVTEDDLDSLDDGLHAFREPVAYTAPLGVPVLPTHDGLGTFPSSAVLEQLWQHEQYNPKRKYDGHHRRASSLQRQFESIEEYEAQTNEEKRMRIEKWRTDQSRAFLEEMERETKRQMEAEVGDVLGPTPTQVDIHTENAPFWRRITRTFIRDIIGIDEPLLSVILGESLPGDVTPRPSSPVDRSTDVDTCWRDRLLQRIARELGVFVHQLSPHPGAFTTYEASASDYAGIPVRPRVARQESAPILPTQVSTFSPDFAPMLKGLSHTDIWGDDQEEVQNNSIDLRREREYWERELDVKMVFRFLKNRFASSSKDEETPSLTRNDASATRTAIIRQHHPLVARAQRSSVRVRRDSRLVLRRPGSSCASEGANSGRVPSRSSSRNYWDIGGSYGSGSVMASGGLMGAWGEA